MVVSSYQKPNVVDSVWPSKISNRLVKTLPPIKTSYDNVLCT